jgi:predicted nucleotidyltransferase
MNQFKEFLEVFKALGQQKVDYVLIGGVAVILHGMERLTRDIDILVKMSPENIDKLRKALHTVFEDDAIEEINIDIMARVGELATFEDLEYETIDYQGIKIKIAKPESLFRLKKDSIRDKDKIDAIFLKKLIEAKLGS